MNPWAVAPISATPATPAPSVDWGELLRLAWEGGGLVLRLGPALLIIGILLALFAAFRFYSRWRWIRAKWTPIEGELKIANLGSVKVKPNLDTVRIAYQAWVEINTRKVGLRFDEENDVIVEVYNSWYELFGVLRGLTKEIPAHKLRDCPDTRELVRIMHKVLNEGLRPHLTRWQAKFRHHYDLLREKQPEIPPQELQQQIPGYAALVRELKDVNAEFVEYGAWLRKIAHGET